MSDQIKSASTSKADFRLLRLIFIDDYDGLCRFQQRVGESYFLGLRVEDEEEEKLLFLNLPRHCSSYAVNFEELPDILQH